MSTLRDLKWLAIFSWFAVDPCGPPAHSSILDFGSLYLTHFDVVSKVVHLS